MKNELLFQRIKKLVLLERKIGIEVLECLYEIDQRRAYAELKYDGLYTYCIKELGFSDSQAYQRIQAMRALKEIPELKPLIEAGTLSVSSVSKVQTHLRQEKRSGTKRSVIEKKDLFTAMIHCTSRQVDVKLAEVRGEKLKRKLVLELDEDLEALWWQVKNLAAHRSKDQDTEVLRILMAEWLKRNDPMANAKQHVKRQSELNSRNLDKASFADFQTESETELKPKPQTQTSTEPKSTCSSISPSSQRTVPLTTWQKTQIRSMSKTRGIPQTRPALQTRRIPAKLKHQIWTRDLAQSPAANLNTRLRSIINSRLPWADKTPRTICGSYAACAIGLWQFRLLVYPRDCRGSKNTSTNF